MRKKTKHNSAHEISRPDKNPPEINPMIDPEDPVLPAEPDFIPEENPSETPPYEVPLPGEKP